MLDFTQRSFLRDCLKKAQRKRVETFRAATNWLGRALKRRPVVADLTGANLEAVPRLMQSRMMSLYCTHQAIRRLLMLWAYAHQRGLAGPPIRPDFKPFRDIADPRGVQAPRACKLRPQPAGTFEHAYQSTVREKVAQGTADKTTESALSRFYFWRGGPTLLVEMNDQLINQFQAALADAGASKSVQRNYPTAVRRVLRLIDARLCRPKAHDWKKRHCRVGQPGTLSHFLEVTYIPLRLVGCRSGSIQQHRVCLDALARHLRREPLSTDLTDDVLAGFMREAIQMGMSPSSHWRRILARAGIKYDRWSGFHAIRRTSATWVAVKGGLVAAMALLGHSEEYVTRRYVDPTKIPGHNVAQFLPPIPRPPAIAQTTAAKREIA